MLIRETLWNSIRSKFTEEEKNRFRAAVTGEAICPKGWIINTDKLPISLRRKLSSAIEAAQAGDRKPSADEVLGDRRAVLADHIERCINEGKKLTKWEEGFLASVAEQLERKGTLTQEQKNCLERIYVSKVS